MLSSNRFDDFDKLHRRDVPIIIFIGPVEPTPTELIDVKSQLTVLTDFGATILRLIHIYALLN